MDGTEKGARVFERAGYDPSADPDHAQSRHLRRNFLLLWKAARGIYSASPDADHIAVMYDLMENYKEARLVSSTHGVFYKAITDPSCDPADLAKVIYFVDLRSLLEQGKIAMEQAQEIVKQHLGMQT
ncbi:hypothetical protein [Mollivirus kamchatka]|nr:hypothetical protein [Mollivirus kamchatka]